MTMTLPPTSPSILFLSPTIITGDETTPPFIADVLVQEGLVARIAPDISAPDARTVDARGHVLCPGFIDMHAHSDLYLLTHPEHEAKISQGCTVSRGDSAHIGSGVLACSGAAQMERWSTLALQCSSALALRFSRALVLPRWLSIASQLLRPPVRIAPSGPR